MELRNWKCLCCWLNVCFWTFWVIVMAYVVFEYIKAFKSGDSVL